MELKADAEPDLSLNSNIIQFLSLIFKDTPETFWVCFIYPVQILRLPSVVRPWANTHVVLPCYNGAAKNMLI
jgi:hypothetical protein